ncbi:hypothetical protein AJ80_02492 [Polytolypa hystricis UAMH7299]|uniref:Ribonucleases P/MRP subunit Pop8-like domain-containing protein n=1 Tax=Polytolypa hystricis (strain UAMH7299) TaxID=1447883 RepID=A0A2B7YR97_POLH7|nr:hypothetical protein AJ80_02492 [Polytolypa hystricis UAMH7299]
MATTQPVAVPTPAPAAESGPEPGNATTTTKPSKRKAEEIASRSDPKGKEIPITFTARNPQWSYLKLELISQPDPSQQPSASSSTSATQPLDPLTARTYLTSALSQFLGLSGTSISIDILKIETSTPSAQTTTSTTTTTAPTTTATTIPSSKRPKNILWIRVPRDDASAVAAAVSSWIGTGGSGVGGGGGSVAWRVLGRANFLGALIGGEGGKLFMP